MPIYDQAMTDLKANYGDTVDAYDALFGNAVPANEHLKRQAVVVGSELILTLADNLRNLQL